VTQWQVEILIPVMHCSYFYHTFTMSVT